MHPNKFTDEERLAAFWSKVDKSGPNDCWLWRGCRQRFGHGVLKWDGRNQTAHRVVWQITNDPIPNGLWVLHHCDNPPCVNPAHLFLGTVQDNNADKMQKGRHVAVSNEQNPSCKLSNSQVIEIRQRFAKGGLTKAELAREYGVSRGQIWQIVTLRERKLDASTGAQS